MEDRDMTLEEYVQYEIEKALRNEFPAIVYEDALSLESGFSYEPTVSSQHVDEVTLKNETSLSEYDDEEYNVTSYNDLFPFNIYLVDDSKLYMNNDDDKIDIKQSSGDISIEPLLNCVLCDFMCANDQLEWVLWYAPWLSDQLEWICGMLHGLVINWSSSAIETSRNRVNAMSPFPPKKFRMGVAIATGRRGYYKPGTRAWVSRISRKIRIPISMYPCRVEERLTIELAEGREVEKIVTTVTKNGVVTRYPGKFHEYQLTDKEKEIERMMIYWEQVEYEVSDEDDSDLKSTARSVPKDYELEDTGGGSGI
ncbi:hypothetical protein Tco_0271592 [Tanacetum coccineum]